MHLIIREVVMNKITELDGAKLFQSIDSLLRFGKTWFDCFHIVKDGYDVSVHDKLKSTIKKYCTEDHIHYNDVRRYVRSTICKLREDPKKFVYIVDLANLKCVKEAESSLDVVLDKKYGWRKRVKLVSKKYMPFEGFGITEDEDGLAVLNDYDIPKWFSRRMVKNGVGAFNVDTDYDFKIPEIFEKFLKHLVSGDMDSYNYILDWLSVSLSARNYCMLCTIGSKGIGKGVLGTIMERLVGRKNFGSTTNRVLNSNFNSVLYNKRIVYIDEIQVKTIEQEDRLKTFVNDMVQIELKGEDAFEAVNTASVYLSSNNMDSVKLTGDNRRFSIVELTDVSVTKVLKPAEFEQLLSDEVIEQLGLYLLTRNIDFTAMKRPFVSKRTDEVRYGALKGWEEYFLEEVLPTLDEVTLVKDMTECISGEFGINVKPSRRAFSHLSDRFSELFYVKYANKALHGARKWCIIKTNDANEIIETRLRNE